MTARTQSSTLFPYTTLFRSDLVRFAVERHDPERAGILVNDDQMVLVLDDLEFVGNTKGVRRNQRHAVRGSPRVLRPALHAILLRARLQLRSGGRRGAATASSAAAAEAVHAREVRLAVGRAWNAGARIHGWS